MSAYHASKGHNKRCKFSKICGKVVGWLLKFINTCGFTTLQPHNNMIFRAYMEVLRKCENM